MSDELEDANLEIHTGALNFFSYKLINNKMGLLILILWIFLKLITPPFCSSISY